MDETQILTAFLCFWLALLGAVLGSFFDCAVSRWAAGDKDIFGGRSRCDSCGHTLGVLDLIPVFSFLIRRGKCKYCGEKIPADCLVSELAGALALGLIGWRFGRTIWLLEFGYFQQLPELAQWVVFAALLLALSLTDCAKRIIPDKLLLVLIVNRLVWFFVLGQGVVTQALDFLKACAVPAALLVLVLLWEKFSNREIMGGGDIKLLFVFAMYLTWSQLLLTLLAGCLLGLLWAAAAGGKKGAALPFGPFLASGALLTVCFGTPLLEWYFALF